MVSEALRRNGFQRPFHPQQVLSWVFFGLDVVGFALLGVPLLPGVAAQAVVAGLYGLSVFTLVLSAYAATRCDPRDPHLRPKATAPPDEDTENLPFCEVCNFPVLERSKHCRLCDKCVHVFDHHCKWLNNCVGHDNYKHFLGAVISVSIMTGIILCCCIGLVIEYVTDEFSLESRLEEVYGSAPKELAFVAYIVLIFVNTPLFLLDTQLVLFHAFLASQHLTTFEYIMTKRDLQEAKELELQEGANSGAVKKPRKGLALPGCIDWIVFSKRRKKRKTNESAAPDASRDAEAGAGNSSDTQPPPSSGAPVGVVVGSVAPAAGGCAPSGMATLPADGVCAPCVDEVEPTVPRKPRRGDAMAPPPDMALPCVEESPSSKPHPWNVSTSKQEAPAAPPGNELPPPAPPKGAA